MFYSQVILSKKGPLGKIWLAAHFEKKLSKAQIFSTDIVNSVDWLLHPSEPLSLRVCGHLMLGIVRIYSKKVKYLMIDCTDAVWKIQLSFKPGKVDIDPQTLNVDDNRFFGHVSTEMDFPILENIAFESAQLPIRQRKKAYPSPNMPLPTTQLPEELSLAHSTSSIEFVRADDRPSIISGRSSVSLGEGRKVSSFLGSQKFEDVLPAFDEKGDFFEEFRFEPMAPIVSPGEDISLPTPEVPMETPPPFDLPEVQGLIPPPQHRNLPLPPSPGTSVPMIVSPMQKKRGDRGKKKKVRIEETIELSDESLRENVRNPERILRRTVKDPLPFQRGIAMKQFFAPTLSLEDKVFSFPVSDLGDEFKDIVRYASNQAPYPFPLKFRAPQPEKSSVGEVPSIPSALGSASSLPSPSYSVPSGRESTSAPELARTRKRRETMEEAALEPSRISGISFETMPVVPEVSFEAPFPISEEMQSYEYGRPSLFEKFIGDKATPKIGGREWTETVEDYVLKQVEEKKSVSFKEICRDADRAFASRCFLQILHLKTANKIDVAQLLPGEDFQILNAA